MYKVLVDSNIFIDFMFHRDGFYNESEKIMKLCEDRKVKPYVTTSMLMDLHYIFKKMSHSNDDADLAIKEILKIFKVLDVNSKDIIESISINAKDFEDYVIESCSRRNGIDYIVTRNKKDFYGKGINIVDPKELINLV